MIKLTNQYYRYFVVLIFLLLSGCASNQNNAPISDAWNQSNTISGATYVVQPGDTLYSIAWGFGVDYRQLAATNNIQAPAYKVQVGQKLTINSTANASPAPAPVAPTKAATTQATVTKASPAPVKSTTASSAKPANTQATTNNTVATPAATPVMSVNTKNTAGIVWAWPVKGTVINNFAATGFDKGIDISGPLGKPVLAAASGKVVYAGNGLRGYGQLLIIKHSDEFLSAYAHNQKLLVREGQSVKIGQMIAKMGNSDAKRVMLHFEIRKAGKPVNPLNYLPAQ